MARRNIPKEERKAVYEKYNGHCAYCGEEIAYEKMQVDHLIPLHKGGADNLQNYMPSCRKCNQYKHTLSLEDFREQIGLTVKRLQGVYAYVMATKYGLVTETDIPVTFYFEKE